MAIKRLAIPSKEIQLYIVGPKEGFKAPRLQSVTMNTDNPSTTVNEIGNHLNVGETKDVANVSLSFNAFDVGWKTFAILAGKTSSDMASGVDISALGEVDAILYVKSDTTTSYVKSAHCRRLQISNFTYNYSVGGESTEDYTATGSERRWLKYDAVVDSVAGTSTTVALSQTPLQLKNGRWLLSLTVDGQYLTEVSGAPAAGQYSVSGTTVTLGAAPVALTMAVYHSNASGTWSDVSDATMPAGIRGKDVTVEISANSVPRVQSITINGNLNVQNVQELGNREMVGYQKQNPTVDGTITVLDTDTDLISLLTYGTIGSGVEWAPGEGCAVSGVTLKVHLQDPCDTTSPYTVLKTLYVPNVVITGDSYTINVNQNTQQAFNWKSYDGQLVIYSGSY